MPYMVLLAEVLASIGYALLKSHLWMPEGIGPPSAGALARAAADTAAAGR